MNTNIVVVTGTLGRDPETFNYGDKLGARYSIAVPGQKEGKTLWLNIIQFNVSQKFLEYLQKGIKVCVTGRLEDNTYTKQDGTKVRDVVVVANNVDLLTFKEKDTQGTFLQKEDNTVEVDEFNYGYDQRVPF